MHTRNMKRIGRTGINKENEAAGEMERGGDIQKREMIQKREEKMESITKGSMGHVW